MYKERERVTEKNVQVVVITIFHMFFVFRDNKMKRRCDYEKSLDSTIDSQFFWNFKEFHH